MLSNILVGLFVLVWSVAIVVLVYLFYKDVQLLYYTLHEEKMEGNDDC